MITAPNEDRFIEKFKENFSIKYPWVNLNDNNAVIEMLKDTFRMLRSSGMVLVELDVPTPEKTVEQRLTELENRVAVLEVKPTITVWGQPPMTNPPYQPVPTLTDPYFNPGIYANTVFLGSGYESKTATGYLRDEYNWPVADSPQSTKCPDCGMSFTNGSVNYSCRSIHCPLGLGPVNLS